MFDQFVWPDELDLLFQRDEGEEELMAMEEDRLHSKQPSLQRVQFNLPPVALPFFVKQIIYLTHNDHFIQKILTHNSSDLKNCTKIK